MYLCFCAFYCLWQFHSWNGLWTCSRLSRGWKWLGMISQIMYSSHPLRQISVIIVRYLICDQRCHCWLRLIRLHDLIFLKLVLKLWCESYTKSSIPRVSKYYQLSGILYHVSYYFNCRTNVTNRSVSVMAALTRSFFFFFINFLPCASYLHTPVLLRSLKIHLFQT